MKNTEIDEFIKTLAVELKSRQTFGEKITNDYVDQVVQKKVADYSEIPSFVITDEELERIKFRLESQYNILNIEEEIILRGGKIERWYDSRKSEITPTYWNAYNEMLVSQARTIDSINANEKVINSILDLSGDPETKGTWSRKGLVMGNVQSGKTQNYLGLINKAIDSGYKVIILLGGHVNELRKQTQERVDEGVIGRESKHLNLAKNTRPKVIGVGSFREKRSDVHSFTTTEGDFKKSFANSLGVNLTGLSEPAIFTIKKNTTVLNSLYEWIRDHHCLDPKENRQLDLPMLLIDDEADYATPNTKYSKDEVTKTNELIRQILTLFNRNTYVGYTATPFANIFIDPDTEEDVIKDDLFPRDFMIKLPVPGDYRGQDFFFEPDSSSAVVINDFSQFVGLKSDSVIERIPESLKNAVRAFVLVIAIRSLRGEKTSHNSMLVNISVQKTHHQRMELLIGEYTQEICNALDSFSSLGMTESASNLTMKSLKKTFDNTFKIKEEYEDVFNVLCASAGKIKVWAINSGNKKSEAKSLDYSLYEENGLCAIVIGGHKLSRGLTLEGLSISYFTRNSKAYDTLMQMCRWFGYRPRYEDLCRVYLPYESLNWYSFISSSIRELYSELDLMSRMQKRPSDFGLKVREHPGAMIITAKNKMGSATSLIRYQELWGQVQRRFRFKNNQELNQKNLKYAETLLNKLINEKKIDGLDNFVLDLVTGVRLIKNVSYKEIINFVENIELPEDNVGNIALINHLRNMEKSGLGLPRIIIYNQKGTRELDWEKPPFLSKSDRAFINAQYDFCGLPMTLPKRLMQTDGVVYSTSSVQLGNKDDEKLFLSKSDQESVKASKGKPAESFDYICSNERDYPGLIIYLFAVGVETTTQNNNDSSVRNVELGHGHSPTLGYSLSLPRPENLTGKTKKQILALIKETRHSYQVNQTYQEQLAFIDVDEQDEDE